MRHLLVATLLLSAGHALAGAAYLGLINTPDANVLMLAVSVLLVLAASGLVLLTSVVAVRALDAGDVPWRAWAAGSSRLLPAALVIVIAAGLLWWLAGAFEAWWMARAGQVDATAIVVGDVTETRWLHVAVHWCVTIVRWLLVPCWIASGLAWATIYGLRHVASLKWLVVGLHPRLVLVAALAVTVLVWLPWQAVYWRPATLGSTMIEMTFTVVKLGALYLAANLAWALVLDAAVRSTRRV